ncbi:GNAT family N-acetyltransferase [Marinibacterium sp. SX1]|uniref:GNAT family N-acetyltransferase n=1 Tax=Marinibacterium sp. SX1 TaxID=3388424 RepID=UPI003D167950
MAERETIPSHDGQVTCAGTEDVELITKMVKAAYSIYIDRLGKLPAPMTADYSALVATGSVYVLKIDDQTVGAVLLAKGMDSIKLNNLVVDPKYQGRGYGRILLEFADKLARSENLPAITLFTNVLMHENIALYTKLGFNQTGRKTENGFDRVYFRKNLD